jgi:hypothetical protein
MSFFCLLRPTYKFSLLLSLLRLFLVFLSLPFVYPPPQLTQLLVLYHTYLYAPDPFWGLSRPLTLFGSCRGSFCSHSNMEGDAAEGRASATSPDKPLSPAAPMSQKVYTRPSGVKVTEEEFQHVLNQAQEHFRGVASPLEDPRYYETMWMLQQHHPRHELLRNLQLAAPLAPPTRTILPVLIQLGLHDQPQRAPPHTMSPSLPPPGTPRRGPAAAQQMGQGMSIDPRLAGASTAFNSQGMGSPGLSHMQPVARPAGMLPPSSAFSPQSATLSPSTLSHMSESPMQSPATHGNPMAWHRAANSPASFAASPRPDVRSPFQTSPYTMGHTLAARDTPGPRPSPMPTLPQTQTIASRRGAATIGGQAGTAARTNLLLPPFSQPTSAQGQPVPPQPRNGAQITDQNHDGQTAGLRMRVNDHLKKLDPETRGRVIGQLKSASAVIQFVTQMDNQEKKLAAQQQATKENAETTNKKRKEPATATEVPSTKRQVIDLTDDNEPQDQDPTDATHQPHIKSPAPRPVYTNPRSSAIPDVPRPGQDDYMIHNQALLYGVQMIDVELDESTHLNVQNWVQKSKDARATNSSLDGSISLLHRQIRANFTRLRRTYSPEPTAAAAVKPKNHGYTFSAIHVPEVTPPTTDEYIEMGCTADEDGNLRAPEEKVVSEERAQLEWDMLQEKAPCVGRFPSFGPVTPCHPNLGFLEPIQGHRCP